MRINIVIDSKREALALDLCALVALDHQKRIRCLPQGFLNI